MNRKLLQLLAGVLLAGSFVSASMAAGADAATVQRGEMEKIIHDYLIAHPEVIQEAMALQQQHEAAAEAAAKKQALTAHRDELVSDKQSPVLGNPSGDVTVVEFFDYRCGYCKRSESSVRELLVKDAKVRLVLKELPILGPDSLLATKSALAARKMGHYKEFHMALMDAETVDAAAIDALAARLGFDMNRFHAERDSEATASEIDKNYKLADALGIGGTPAFVVGDRLIPGAANVSTLLAYVKEARRGHDIVSK